MASNARSLAAPIALVVVLLGFAALAVRVAMTLEQPPDALEHKLTGAERYLYYRMTAKAGPVFELTGGEPTIRLVTHAVVPGADAYDPARELEYGVRIELALGGGRTWRRELWTRARQSKARRVADHGGMWLDENVFALDAPIELTDDRLLVVPLPDTVPPGARLQVTLLGDLAEGYLRAYTPIVREDVAQRVRDLLPAQRGRIAEQISYLPWDRLANGAELWSLRFAERRLSAEGKDGEDYHTRILYTTEFRLRSTTLIERGQVITPEHALAINVVGPTTLSLAIGRPAALPATPGTLDLRWIGDGAPPPASQLPLPARDETTRHELAVPAGVYTLALAASAAAAVELAGPPGASAALGGLANAPLVPDEQLVPAYLTGPTGAPVVFAIPGPTDLVGRVLRIDVRVLAGEPMPEQAVRAVVQWPAAAGAPPPPALGDPAAAAALPAGRPIRGALALEAIDAQGRVIASSSAPIDSEVSAFESVRLFGKRVAPVSEPISVRFVVPPGGRGVRLRSDQPAIVQAAAPIAVSPPADVLDAPYDAVPVVDMVWRYARYAERGWHPVRPHNLAELGADRAVVLAAQARLEPRVVPPAPEIAGVALTPAGRIEKQTVVERVLPADAAGFVARWAEGHYTRLAPGAPTPLDLARAPGRASVSYAATGDEAAVVGARVRISVDGRRVDERVLSAARGSFDLPAGLTGRHAVAVDTSAPVRLLVDRPPAAGARAELHALRSVYRVTDGERLRVVVSKRSAAAQNVNIVLYARAAASPAGATVRVVVDGGAPARVTGVALAKWTLADRVVPLPPADRPATLGFANAAGGVLYPRVLAIALGDDLPAGAHAIDVSMTGGGGAWARLFTLDDQPIAPRALQWRDATDTSEGSSP